MSLRHTNQYSISTAAAQRNTQSDPNPPYPTTPPATNEPQKSPFFNNTPPPRPPKVSSAETHRLGSPAPPPPAPPKVMPQDSSNRTSTPTGQYTYNFTTSSRPSSSQTNQSEPSKHQNEQIILQPDSQVTSRAKPRFQVPQPPVVYPQQSQQIQHTQQSQPPQPPPKDESYAISPIQAVSQQASDQLRQHRHHHHKPDSSLGGTPNNVSANGSQVSVSDNASNSEEKNERRRRRKDSKGPKEKNESKMSEMDRKRRSLNAKRNKLRVLSLDGGGIRGYSMLLLLESLMVEIFVELHGRAPKRGEESAKPCEVFDLIGGTGTGGLIAIMLGRLRMSVQTSKEVYTRMTRYVFETDKRVAGIPYGETLFKASKLERAIQEIVRERTRDDDLDIITDLADLDEDWDIEPKGGHYDEDGEKELERLMSVAGRSDSLRIIGEASRLSSERPRRRGNPDALLHDKRKGRCKTMVTAVYKGSTSDSTPACFRTYASGVESVSYPDCRIWEAGRATSATLAAFKPIKIGQDVFLDEGHGTFNPAPFILEEALINEWPGRELGCLVSLGTGKRPTNAKMGDNKVQWWENLSTSLDVFTQARRRLMTKIDDCETIHQKMLTTTLAQYNISSRRYFRFNVPSGVGDVALNEWNRLSEVSTSTRVYVSNPEVSDDIKECAQRLAKGMREGWEKKMEEKGVLRNSLDGDGHSAHSGIGGNHDSNVYYEMPGVVPVNNKYNYNGEGHGHNYNNNSNVNNNNTSNNGNKYGQYEGGLDDGPVELPGNDAGPVPMSLPPAPPAVPNIMITPPTVKHPGGRKTDVELPG